MKQVSLLITPGLLELNFVGMDPAQDPAEAYVLEDDRLPLLVFGALSLVVAGARIDVEGTRLSLPRPAGLLLEKLITDRTGEKGERDLLVALGFGLDLSCCAVSGVTTDLAYVSPRTGRAVSRAAGMPYHDKLLCLPDFLWRDAPADEAQLDLGMTLTGHFLVHHVFAPQGRPSPAARLRLAERMRQSTAAAR